MFIFLNLLCFGLLLAGFGLGRAGLWIPGLLLGAGLAFTVFRVFQIRAAAADARIDWINGGTLAILRQRAGRTEVLDWEMVFAKRVFFDVTTGEIGLRKTLLGLPVAFWVQSGSAFRDLDWTVEPVEISRYHPRAYRWGYRGRFRNDAMIGDGSVELWCNWRLQLVPGGGGPRITIVDYSGRYTESNRQFMERIRDLADETLRNAPPPR